MAVLPSPLLLLLAALSLLLAAVLVGSTDRYDTEQCIYQAQSNGQDISACR